MGRRAGRAGRVLYRVGLSRPLAGRVLYRVGLSRPLAGRVLYRKWPRMRDKVLPARVVGGGSGKKFSLHAKSGPKSAFWGLLGEFCTGWACQGRLLGEFCTGSGSACGIKFSLHAKSGPKLAFWGSLGEFCTGWAAEPGSRASFVSLRARRGLHRAFLAPIAPPIDAAVMRCRYAWARWPCPTGRREPHPGSVGYTFIAPRKPPARASCAGGRQREHQRASASISKHQQATQAVQTKRQEGRKQCKPRGLTSSRASLGRRWFRAAGSRRAGRGGSRPRARGAR